MSSMFGIEAIIDEDDGTISKFARGSAVSLWADSDNTCRGDNGRLPATLEELDQVIVEGTWTIKQWVWSSESDGDVEKTQVMENPTWVELWDFADAECDGHRNVFEGVDIDRVNKVIELSLGS